MLEKQETFVSISLELSDETWNRFPSMIRDLSLFPLSISRRCVTKSQHVNIHPALQSSASNFLVSPPRRYL